MKGSVINVIYRIMNQRVIAVVSASLLLFISCSKPEEVVIKLYPTQVSLVEAQFIVIHPVKDFGIVNKAEVDVFSGTLLLFR